MPTLRQLEYLVALDDLKNFGRAAQASHVSQPTLSQQLRVLEERLGAPLIDRHSANSRLTPIGRDIAERARGLIVEVKNIRELARRAAENAAGIIHIGTSTTLGPYLMPSILAALKLERPGLQIYIREGIPIDQVMEITRGKLDFFVGPLPLAGENLMVEPLFKEPLHLVAPVDHPLSRADIVTKADLLGVTVLGFDPRHHLQHQVVKLCEDHGLILAHNYQGTSLDTVSQMTVAGLGLAILPDIYCRQEVEPSTTLKCIRVADWHPSRSIGAAWLANAIFEPVYKDLADIIRAHAMLIMNDRTGAG